MTPDQSKQILWHNGILDWKLRPEQRLFKQGIDNQNHRLIIGNISRRLGKSFTLVLYAIEQAIKIKQKIRFGSAYLSELEEFIIPAFDLILTDCPETIKPEYKRTRKTYEFPNGSEIKLVGLDKNPNGLRGNAINVIIIDEAGFVSNLKYLYTSVIIPATMKQKNVKIVMISTPPESPEHYFVEMINKAQVSDDAFYLTLTIDDISDLSPEERKSLLDEVGGENSSTARREFFCEIIIDEDRAIAPAFDEALHVANIDPEHVKYNLFGDSGGVRDLTVWHKIGYCHNTRKIIVRDEIWFKHHTPTSEIIQAVKDKWPEDGSTTYAKTLDCAGQLQIDYAANGLPVSTPQKESFDETLLLVNNSFYNCQVLIHPDCKLLIKTLTAGLTNKNRTDFERTETLGHADAVMSYAYGLRGVDRVTDLRPKPKPSQVFTIDKPDPIVSELEKLKGF